MFFIRHRHKTERFLNKHDSKFLRERHPIWDLIPHYCTKVDSITLTIVCSKYNRNL